MSDPVPAPPPPPPSDEEVAKGLVALRQNFKVAAIAHWAVLFGHHVGFEFDTEAFELDLLGVKPDTQVPEFLGKVLNTLANDRNTNRNNWLNALRRSYNRRVTNRADNPFYSWHRVPGSVVDAEREEERAREEAEYEAELRQRFGPGGAPGEGDAADAKSREGPRAIWDDEERKLKEAERALYRASGKGKAKSETPAAAVKKEDEPAVAIDPALDPALAALDPALSGVGAGAGVKAEPGADAVVHEAGAADVNMSALAPEASVPVTEEALDDGFNAELADAVAQDAAAEGEAGEGDEEWYEEQRAVEWNDLSLETKLDAIYNVCEWHMVDPERQFRKYLQWDGEAAWRLDPYCVDAEGNKYFHTADDRLWVQRPPPPPSAEQPAGQVAVRRPRSLLGLRAGPRDKSKKGTVTGVMRFKLRKDLATGEFVQVDENEEAASAGPVASGSGAKGEDGEDGAAAHPTSDAARGEMEDDEAGTPTTKAAPLPEVDVEMPGWEQAYWEERLRAETTPGFVEWEALCVTIDEWLGMADELADSTDPALVKLRNYITDQVVPSMEEEAKRREEAKAEELAALERKRSVRNVAKESLAEEEQRAERATRAARHQVRSYTDDGLTLFGAGEPSDSGTPGASGGGAKGESREDRLRKREEEKRAREEAEERKLVEELREQEREEARKANGGVLPVELMNEEEKRAWDKLQEKERKKNDGDAKKRAKEDAKKARARERRAELKAERDAEAAAEAEAIALAEQQAAAQAQAHAAAQAQAAAAAAAAADDPWYLDCEICQAAGWNYDDGQEMICCDQCEEWQHLPCHRQADALQGKPPQPYTDEDFQWVCARCRGVQQRRPRPPLPPPGSIPVLTYLPQPYEPPAAPGKRRASSAHAQHSAKKPKQAKQPPPKANGGSIPYGHGGHPLYHPSAYSHPQAVATYTAAQAVSPVAAPAPVPAPAPAPAPVAAPTATAAATAAQQQAQASMSYEDLKAAIEANPALMGQLPPEYQAHFAQLLGLPLPA
ncbi:hypothetical protein JCM10450v2_000892 [Rhodotorula kratochvilovae]